MFLSYQTRCCTKQVFVLLVLNLRHEVFLYKVLLDPWSLKISVFGHFLIYNYAIKNDYACQLALETIMACGIGICQGCTIEKKCKNDKHSYRDKYALACIDGPVFNIEELSDAF